MGAKSRVCSLCGGICVSAPDGINSIIPHGSQTHTCARTLTQPFARLAGAQGLCHGWGTPKSHHVLLGCPSPIAAQQKAPAPSAHPTGGAQRNGSGGSQELLALVSRHSPSALNQAVSGDFSPTAP